MQTHEISVPTQIQIVLMKLHFDLRDVCVCVLIICAKVDEFHFRYLEPFHVAPEWILVRFQITDGFFI